MDHEIFSSNNSILRSSAIHPIIATADLFSQFEGEGITSAFVQAYDIEVIIVTDFKFAFWEQMKKVSPFSWFIFNLSKYLVSQLVCNSLQVSFYWPLYDIKPLGSRSRRRADRLRT